LSNGLAEGFVHAFKRDYVNVHKLRDAGSVLAQHAAWIADYQPPGSISNSNCRRRGSSARVRVPNGIRAVVGQALTFAIRGMAIRR
jgi:hypothetical protein